MKKLLTLSFCCLLLFSCNNKKSNSNENTGNGTVDTSDKFRTSSKVNPYAPVDVSPMDMSYYPVDYPKAKNKNTTEPPLARLVYSRPHLQGRKLFEEILKYGEPWRLGANESTELDFYKNVIIQGKLIKIGRYVLYCIPEKDKWTIVLNSNIDSWGLHPDTTKDLERFVIPVKKNPDLLEYFTIVFRQAGNGVELFMAWDDVEAVLPFTY